MARLACVALAGALSVASNASAAEATGSGIDNATQSPLLIVPSTAEPIAIGISITQSPPGSVIQGTQIKDGMEIAKDMVNAKGGVLGRPILLIYEDNQGIPEKGRAATERLITRGVVAVTGGHQSSVCLAEIEVTHRSGTPYVNTNCYSDDVRKKGYAEVFNPSSYNTRSALAMAETIAAMGVKSVIAFAENTDFGIGQAKILAEFIKAKAPGTQFGYTTLDRAGKDFARAVVALRADPPEMVVNLMLPPAAYILIKQLFAQGVAPSAKTWLFDGADIIDYPDFWPGVKDAGRWMISVGQYHPRMAMSKLGQEVATEYTRRTKNEPNRLVFQSADSLFLIADAIKQAKGTDPTAIVKALQTMRFEGARGAFQFGHEAGTGFQQWVDIPYVVYQFTDVNQPISKTTLIKPPGEALDVNKLQRLH
jgi:branched-chain amino acid transport system substrate-binding protein